MWILKKSVKIKSSVLDSKGKPQYEQREGGDPCPEASAWPKPELWCREVADDSSDAKAALSRYKERTGHELGSYVPPNKDEETAAEKVKLLKKLDELKGKGVAVEYSQSDTMVSLTKKVENAEKALAATSPLNDDEKTANEGNAGGSGKPDEEEEDFGI